MRAGAQARVMSRGEVRRSGYARWYVEKLSCAHKMASTCRVGGGEPSKRRCACAYVLRGGQRNPRVQNASRLQPCARSVAPRCCCPCAGALPRRARRVVRVGARAYDAQSRWHAAAKVYVHPQPKTTEGRERMPPARIGGEMRQGRGGGRGSEPSVPSAQRSGSVCVGVVWCGRVAVVCVCVGGR